MLFKKKKKKDDDGVSGGFKFESYFNTTKHSIWEHR